MLEKHFLRSARSALATPFTHRVWQQKRENFHIFSILNMNLVLIIFKCQIARFGSASHSRLRLLYLWPNIQKKLHKIANACNRQKNDLHQQCLCKLCVLVHILWCYSWWNSHNFVCDHKQWIKESWILIQIVVGQFTTKIMN